jgi:hypothetical protein
MGALSILSILHRLQRRAVYLRPKADIVMGSNTRKLLTSGLLALGIAVPVVLAVEATHQQTCDRACLIQFANSYVDAALAHRAPTVEISPDVKTTENGRPVALGEGVWKTAKSLSSRQLVADASSGEAVVFGVLTAEDGRQSLAALRLKVHRGRVENVETVVSGDGR